MAGGQGEPLESAQEKSPHQDSPQQGVPLSSTAQCHEE